MSRQNLHLSHRSSGVRRGCRAITSCRRPLHYDYRWGVAPPVGAGRAVVPAEMQFVAVGASGWELHFVAVSAGWADMKFVGIGAEWIVVPPELEFDAGPRAAFTIVFATAAFGCVELPPFDGVVLDVLVIGVVFVADLFGPLAMAGAAVVTTAVAVKSPMANAIAMGLRMSLPLPLDLAALPRAAHEQRRRAGVSRRSARGCQAVAHRATAATSSR